MKDFIITNILILFFLFVFALFMSPERDESGKIYTVSEIVHNWIK